MSSANRSSLASYARSILRIVVGITFSCHGFQKLFGFFGGLGGSGAKAHFFSLFWAAGFLESLGGVLILFGLFTNVVAFILCGEMAFAYFSVHLPRGFWPILNAGEPAVLYCFIFLYLATAGAGPLSLDQLIRRKSTS